MNTFAFVRGYKEARDLDEEIFMRKAMKPEQRGALINSSEAMAIVWKRVHEIARKHKANAEAALRTAKNVGVDLKRPLNPPLMLRSSATPE